MMRSLNCPTRFGAENVPLQLNRTVSGNIKMNEFTETIITKACTDIIQINALKLGSSYPIKLDCLF